MEMLCKIQWDLLKINIWFFFPSLPRITPYCCWHEYRQKSAIGQNFPCLPNYFFLCTLNVNWYCDYLKDRKIDLIYLAVKTIIWIKLCEMEQYYCHGWSIIIEGDDKPFISWYLVNIVTELILGNIYTKNHDIYQTRIFQRWEISPVPFQNNHTLSVSMQ